MSPPAFASTRHDLGALAPGLALEPLAANDAPDFGRSFAAIEPWRSYPYEADALTAYFAVIEPGAPRFLLRHDGTCAGVLGLRLDWLRGPYIQFLGLKPGLQGLGLGGATLAWIASEAIRTSAHNIFVCASDFNARALSFYRAHGFVEIGKIPDLVVRGRTEVLLRRQLEAATP